MAYVVGIDGCKEAWISVSMETDSRHLFWNKHYLLSDLLTQMETVKIVGIDIPIGLPEKGPRACDIKARRLLEKRGSSVFPAPVQAVLGAKDYKNACDVRFGIEGKKMSQQAWAIVPKVGEIDLLLRQRPEYRHVLYEVHPEVSFYFMGNNKPNRYSKKKRLGMDERIEKLFPFFQISGDYVRAIRHEYRTSEDDIVDALAALWSAERILHGEGVVLQEDGSTEGPRIYA
jgi:predicted RNase H-like nuclease